jgi:hypothetical protein
MERHWRSTQRQLAAGGCALLVLLGGGLVGLLYGSGAAVAAVAIVLVVAGLGVLIWLLLTLMQRWAERG